MEDLQWQAGLTESQLKRAHDLALQMMLEEAIVIEQHRGDPRRGDTEASPHPVIKEAQ